MLIFSLTHMFLARALRLGLCDCAIVPPPGGSIPKSKRRNIVFLFHFNEVYIPLKGNTAKLEIWRTKNYHTYLPRYLEPVRGQLLVHFPVEIDYSDPFLPFTCTFIILVANLRWFGLGTCIESFSFQVPCRLPSVGDELVGLCVCLMNALINLLMRQVESHYMKVCPDEKQNRGYLITRLHKQGLVEAEWWGTWSLSLVPCLPCPLCRTADLVSLGTSSWSLLLIQNRAAHPRVP